MLIVISLPQTMDTQIILYQLGLLWVSVFAGIVSPDPKDDGPLILTPLIEKHEIQKARQLSKVDPTLFAGVNSHAAYLTVNKTHNSNMFFWFFPVEGMPLNSTPWIIWLQGGPGLSSLYGLFNEIGPLQCINGPVEKMNITWGTNYSLLFIDNPVGTGFSFTDKGGYVYNDDMVGAALLNFIHQFLQVFPELRKAPLFIAGQQYAGKYIPAFGHYIHHDKSLSINLRGLAIGNGWIDPPTLLHYSEWGLQLGYMDLEQAAKIKKLEDDAINYLNKNDYEKYAANIREMYMYLINYAYVDEYNIMNEVPSNDPAIKNCAEIILNTDDVQSAIHAKIMNFHLMNFDAYIALFNDSCRTVKPWLEELLEHYGVMAYSGQLDLQVPYALSVHTYRSLNWTGAQAYRDAVKYHMFDPDIKRLATLYVKESGNFMDVLVRNAGQFVSRDQPRAAKQAIDMFINKFK